MGRFADAIVRDTKLQTGATHAELLEQIVAEQRKTNALLAQQNGYLYALLERGGSLGGTMQHQRPGG